MKSVAACFAVLSAVVLAAACTPAAPRPDRFEVTSPHTVRQGERLARILGCTGCHGKALTGQDWSDDLGTLWTANLTQSAAAHDDRALAAMMVTGRHADGRPLLGMPSFLFTRLDPRETAAVLDFVRSKPLAGAVHPAPRNEPALDAMIAQGKILTSVQEVTKYGSQVAPVARPGHARARHIVRATCVECHGIDLAGRPDPLGGPPRPDIRGIAASYSPEDFDRLLSTGIGAGGRKLGLMREVALGRYAHLTPDERRGIHAYLKVLGESAAP